MSILRKTVVFLLVALGLVAVSGYSLVVAFQSTPLTFTALASSDTFVSSYAPGAKHGESPVLWVSIDNGQLNWSLIQFNIYGKLHPGDLVVGAKIRVTVITATALEWPPMLTTIRTLASWTENTTFATAPRTAPDTITSTPVGTGTPPPPGTVLSLDVTKQFRRWQSYGGPSNFGTMLYFGSDAAGSSLGMASRENTQYAQPMVEITYQPGPPSIYGYSIVPTAMTRVE